jgi:hypothetical protein
VQGREISPPGRTAAFDGLCCEIRGLGLELTLGQVVDSFEPVVDKYCGSADNKANKKEKVTQIEEAGRKIVEIQAGDYEPVIEAPSKQPIITSLTVGKNGSKTSFEVGEAFAKQFDISEEPLIDDIDDEAPEISEEDEAKQQALVSMFIDNETADLLPKQEEFPSPSELEDLSSELANIGNEDASTTTTTTTTMTRKQSLLDMWSTDD